MNPVATFAIVALAVWTVASLCYAFRVPPVHDALKRINWFRSFAHWTMFAASPDPRIRPGGFVVLYRDEPEGEWLVAIDGHHWTWHSFLLSPPRFLAARVHHIGQFFAAVRLLQSEPTITAELRNQENVIASYLRRAHPLRPGTSRTVRIVKRFGRSDPAAEELARQFTMRADE